MAYSTIMTTPLLMSSLLDRGAQMQPDNLLVTKTSTGVATITYREHARRVKMLGAALSSWGLQRKERVGTFCWNTNRCLLLPLPPFPSPSSPSTRFLLTRRPSIAYIQPLAAIPCDSCHGKCAAYSERSLRYGMHVGSCFYRFFCGWHRVLTRFLAPPGFLYCAQGPKSLGTSYGLPVIVWSLSTRTFLANLHRCLRLILPKLAS